MFKTFLAVGGVLTLLGGVWTIIRKRNMSVSSSKDAYCMLYEKVLPSAETGDLTLVVCDEFHS